MFIYLIENTINNKIYIGQTVRTIEERMIEHKHDSKRKKFPINNAIRKYGWKNFKFSIIDDTATTQEQLDKFEMLWIDFFQSTNREIGYNLQKGGSGIGKHTEETKRKISIAHTGMKASEETKKKMSETRANMSEETKKKMSLAHKGLKYNRRTSNELESLIVMETELSTYKLAKKYKIGRAVVRRILKESK